MPNRVPGKGWSTFGFTTGIVASVAANVAHSFVPPAQAPATWHPAPVAIVFGAFWPIALLVAIEVIARVEWPSGKSWKVVRHGGLLAVASIAALISYRHMSGLLAAYGEDHLSASLGPLAVDGLMAVCTAALLATSHHGVPERRAEVEPSVASPEVPEDRSALPVAPERQGGNPGGKHEEARQAYVASVATGKPLSGKELGEQFGMSGRWGRLRIKQARDQGLLDTA